MSPTVSVIITAFNSEEFLRLAVDSSLQQTFSDFELIVVDDASTDGLQHNVSRSKTRGRVPAD